MIEPYYNQGGITIYHGDLYDHAPGILAGKIILTDIPYNCSQASGGLRKLHYGDWDVNFDWLRFAKLAALHCNRTAYIFCGDEQASGIKATFKGAGHLARLLAWIKPAPTILNGDKLWLPSFELCVFAKRPGVAFNEHCRPGHFTLPPDRPRFHPNQKPLALMKRLLAASTDGESVIDPFMGSGTTLVAAKELGLNAIGIEIEERYCEIAAKRLAQGVFEFSGL